MEIKKIIIVILLIVLILGSLSFIKYKQIANKQATKLHKLERKNEKLKGKLENIKEDGSDTPLTNVSTHDTTINTIKGFLKALYEPKSNNLTEHFESLKPFLDEEGSKLFKPESDNIISNDIGSGGSTVSEIDIYTQNVDDNTIKVMAFFTLSPNNSNMFMVLVLQKNEGSFKIHDIIIVRPYKK